MAGDVIRIEILEDGLIKTTTDPISAANHAKADAFLKLMSTLAGGETTRERRRDALAHHHEHEHDHEGHHA